MTKEESKQLGQRYLEAFKKFTDHFDALVKNDELEINESNIYALRRIYDEMKKYESRYWNNEYWNSINK